ncbi:hypothetical protein Tco_0012208 [Tanacetum coccineum]
MARDGVIISCDGVRRLKRRRQEFGDCVRSSRLRRSPKKIRRLTASQFTSDDECDIGDEGEWTGAVCGHTCMSISVLGEQGSASGTLSGTSVMLTVLAEEGKAKAIAFDEIGKTFCRIPSLEPEVVHA